MSVLKAAQVVVTTDDEATLTPAVRDALAAAHQAGVEEGRAEAEIVSAHALAALAEELKATAERQSEATSTQIALDAEILVALAADLASWFVEGVVHAEPSSLIAAAEAVIAGTSGRSMIELSVHPDQVEAVAGVAPGNVEVRGDQSLGRADHRVTVGDMSVERIWADAISDVGPAIATALEVGT
jgi:flagellar biosynthesis/type III secretory pathway protein FliH